MHLEDSQENGGYIEDIKKECANSNLDSLKSLIKQELSYSEQYTNQVSIVTRRFREMELYERKEQVSVLYPNPVDTLKVRKKHQHLNFGERLHISREVNVCNNNKNEIAMKYKLSDTTIEDTMREFSLHFYIPKLEDFKKSNRIMYSPEIRKLFSEFIKNNHELFSSKDAIKAVRKDLGISIESHQLIKYMKKI